MLLLPLFCKVNPLKPGDSVARMEVCAGHMKNVFQGPCVALKEWQINQLKQPPRTVSTYNCFFPDFLRLRNSYSVLFTMVALEQWIVSIPGSGLSVFLV